MTVRGEISLQLGTKKIKLVPSFANLMEVEDKLAPDTVFGLLDKAQGNALTGKELVTILYCGTGKYNDEAMEWTSEFTFIEFGELCLKHNGIVGLLAPAVEFLTSLMVSMKAETKSVKKPATRTRKKRTPSRGKTTSK